MDIKSSPLVGSLNCANHLTRCSFTLNLGRVKAQIYTRRRRPTDDNIANHSPTLTVMIFLGNCGFERFPADLKEPPLFDPFSWVTQNWMAKAHITGSAFSMTMGTVAHRSWIDRWWSYAFFKAQNQSFDKPQPRPLPEWPLFHPLLKILWWIGHFSEIGRPACQIKPFPNRDPYQILISNIWPNLIRINSWTARLLSAGIWSNYTKKHQRLAGRTRNHQISLSHTKPQTVPSYSLLVWHKPSFLIFTHLPLTVQ